MQINFFALAQNSRSHGFLLELLDFARKISLSICNLNMSQQLSKKYYPSFVFKAFKEYFISTHIPCMGIEPWPCLSPCSTGCATGTQLYSNYRLKHHLARFHSILWSTSCCTFIDYLSKCVKQASELTH